MPSRTSRRRRVDHRAAELARVRRQQATWDRLKADVARKYAALA